MTLLLQSTALTSTLELYEIFEESTTDVIPITSVVDRFDYASYLILG